MLSIVSIKGLPAFSVYSATKAAVSSFALSWTNDLKERKIGVNVISPGPIDTLILDGLSDTEEPRQGIRAQFPSIVPLGGMGKPD